MVNRKHYYEKKIHKLNKRLTRLKMKPQAFSNYDELYASVVTKINSCTKAAG